MTPEQAFYIYAWTTIILGLGVEFWLLMKLGQWIMSLGKLVRYLVWFWFWFLWVPFTVHTEAPQDIYHLMEWHW